MVVLLLLTSKDYRIPEKIRDAIIKFAFAVSSFSPVKSCLMNAAVTCAQSVNIYDLACDIPFFLTNSVEHV